jgi:zinc transporter ZupT
MAAVSVIGVAIGFTVAGWVAGFGVALALYLDDRFAPASRGIQLGAAAVTAIGATVVAAAAGAFPETMPAIVPYVTVAAGLLALGLVVREPSPPTSRVDARYAAPLDQTRLHVSRTTIGVLVFLMTTFLGAETEQLLPILGALLLVVISNELEPKPRDRR